MGFQALSANLPLPISAASMEWFASLTFASDAELLALWGALFLATALGALVGERARQKRARIDRVGWMPWTGIFLCSAVAGGGLLVVAVPGLLSS